MLHLRAQEAAHKRVGAALDKYVRDWTFAAVCVIAYEFMGAIVTLRQ